MGAKSLPTIDEIVNTLKRSFIPTILIEGTDDVFIYRWLKTHLNTNLVSLQPCGGRCNLIAVYERKAEFSDKNVIFIADKDSYRFEGIPSDKTGIIFTSGYCIENDIFAGSNILNLLDNKDLEKHEILRDIIGKWFSFELEKFRNTNSQNRTLQVSAHINLVSPEGLNTICPNFSCGIGYTTPSKKIVDEVFLEYNLNVRGKQLFQMLSRFLSAKGRFSKFSDKNLIEIALKQGNNNYLELLIQNIQDALVAA